jgi:hypothetical protein
MNTDKLKNWTIYQATQSWPKSPVIRDEASIAPCKDDNINALDSETYAKNNLGFSLPKDMDISTRRKLDFFIKSFPKAAKMTGKDELAKIHIEKINALLARQILEELGIGAKEQEKAN